MALPTRDEMRKNLEKLTTDPPPLDKNSPKAKLNRIIIFDAITISLLLFVMIPLLYTSGIIVYRSQLYLAFVLVAVYALVCLVGYDHKRKELMTQENVDKIIDAVQGNPGAHERPHGAHEPGGSTKRFCPYCGKPLTEDAPFCAYCGKRA